MRRVRVTFVAVEKQNYYIFVSVSAGAYVRVDAWMRTLVRVYSLAYPACNAYALHWDVFVATLTPPYFSTLSHKWHDFMEKISNIKFVSIFPTSFSKIFLTLKRI